MLAFGKFHDVLDLQSNMLHLSDALNRLTVEVYAIQAVPLSAWTFNSVTLSAQLWWQFVDLVLIAKEMFSILGGRERKFCTTLRCARIFLGWTPKQSHPVKTNQHYKSSKFDKLQPALLNEHMKSWNNNAELHLLDALFDLLTFYANLSQSNKWNISIKRYVGFKQRSIKVLIWEFRISYADTDFMDTG